MQQGKQQQDKQQQEKRQAGIFFYLVVGYGVTVFVLWLAQWIVSEQIPLMGMIKSSLHIFLIPAMLLLPLFLLLRRWRLAAILGPVVVVFLLSWGVFFLPRGQEDVATGAEIRVATFNLQAPNEDAVTSLVDIVREVDADVVAVQELSIPAADRFSTALADLYPHQALNPQPEGNAGQGMLSRYPILADDYWQAQEEPMPLGHQRVVLEIDGVETVFYNTHPVPPYTPNAGIQSAEHTRALRYLIDQAKDDSAPVILMGDFNMSDHFHEYRRIVEEFTDAYKAVGDIGFGFTYPHDKWTGVPPLVRLDYVFYSDDWQGISADVWPGSGSSDHAPLVAEVKLRSKE
jgi:vancomycin resistance protein VanJ